MSKTNTKTAQYNFLIKLFSSFSDEVFVVDNNGNILYKNAIAEEKYPKIINLNKLSHIFNFEICILKSEDIIKYTPIYAALVSPETFFANVTKQINDKFFVEYSINAIPLENNTKIIIFRNDANKNLAENYEKLEKKIEKLEEKIISDEKLKTKLENNLLRTNLINLVSEKVREYIDTNKIIKVVLEQLKKTIEISKVEFIPDIEIKNNNIHSEINEEDKSIKLFVPVFTKKHFYGQLILYRNNLNKSWQKDEIDLLKNISSLLSTAFSKEELYRDLETQKAKLENALIQLKNAQLQIIQSEKMATLGKLVASVAHEINTPLGAISINLDLLSKYSQKAKSLTDLQEFLAKIEPINKDGLYRIETLVKSLKNFSRLDEAEKKKVDLTEGIQSTLNLLVHETKNKITVKTDFQTIPLIYCYPDYINQVFMNILKNACQSITTKGTVSIATRQEENWVIITISDTGSGISKENLEKIFDFGFTTKKFGQGTGLGLALSKKIIDEHQGKIEVSSELNKGTTFRIYLPITQ